MPVYSATSKFSIENLIQIWSRREAWKQVQRRMIKENGKSLVQNILAYFVEQSDSSAGA